MITIAENVKDPKYNRKIVRLTDSIRKRGCICLDLEPNFCSATLKRTYENLLEVVEHDPSCPHAIAEIIEQQLL